MVYSILTYRLVWRFICLVKLFNSSTEIEFAKRLNGRVSRPFEFEFDLFWYQFRKFQIKISKKASIFIKKIAKKISFWAFSAISSKMRRRDKKGSSLVILAISYFITVLFIFIHSIIEFHLVPSFFSIQ